MKTISAFCENYLIDETLKTEKKTMFTIEKLSWAIYSNKKVIKYYLDTNVTFI